MRSSRQCSLRERRRAPSAATGRVTERVIHTASPTATSSASSGDEHDRCACRIGGGAGARLAVGGGVRVDRGLRAAGALHGVGGGDEVADVDVARAGALLGLRRRSPARERLTTSRRAPGTWRAPRRTPRPARPAGCPRVAARAWRSRRRCAVRSQDRASWSVVLGIEVAVEDVQVLGDLMAGRERPGVIAEDRATALVLRSAMVSTRASTPPRDEIAAKATTIRPTARAPKPSPRRAARGRFCRRSMDEGRSRFASGDRRATAVVERRGATPCDFIDVGQFRDHVAGPAGEQRRPVERRRPRGARAARSEPRGGARGGTVPGRRGHAARRYR